jgi:hypothetical protein
VFLETLYGSNIHPIGSFPGTDGDSLLFRPREEFPSDSMSRLQLGQVILSVSTFPLNIRFWQYGQKYQADKCSADSISFKCILFIVSILMIIIRLARSFALKR